MSNMLLLSSAVKYSSKRISADKLDINNYISIDNILQNKSGVTAAAKLPPGNTGMPGYEPGHILVGNIRPYLKKIWFADRKGGCSPDVLNFEVNDNFDPRFIYYSLLRDEFFDHVMRGSKGSKMPRGDKNQIMEYLLPSYDLQTQQKISSFLTKLDRKIDLNNTIGQELEFLAKAVFDYWFVQFDFSDGEGKPFKSNGGNMIWNEELKHYIPEGWEVRSLEGMISFDRGISYTSKDIASKNGIPMINLASIDTNRNYKPHESKCFSGKYSSNKLVSYGDMLIACTDLTQNADIIGSPIFVPKESEKYLYSMDLAKVNILSDDLIDMYLYMNLRTNFYHNYIKYFASGTNVLHLNLDGILWYPMVLPPKEIQLKYAGLIRPFIEKKAEIINENYRLSELRDWLLPMLMNGQVKIKDNKHE